MFIYEDLIIKNCNLGQPTKTDCPDENLTFFAPSCLDDFYQYNHPRLMSLLGFEEIPDDMTRMMAALPYIAEYYDIDKNALLDAWVSIYGLNRMRNEE